MVENDPAFIALAQRLDYLLDLHKVTSQAAKEFWEFQFNEARQDISALQQSLKEETVNRKAANRDLRTDFEEYKRSQEKYHESQVKNRKEGFYSGYLPAILALMSIAAIVMIAVLGTP